MAELGLEDLSATPWLKTVSCSEEGLAFAEQESLLLVQVAFVRCGRKRSSIKTSQSFLARAVRFVLEALILELILGGGDGGDCHLFKIKGNVCSLETFGAV